ncbi:MAG TPA: hypothetical protein VFU77_01530 [Steroidobacteraceae bacterium]|nr:hypothetical protein [Steroidobacteraceae bacterium]
MDIRDTLTIFAQIAVAFAGFGGLAGLVAPKLGGDGAKLAAARLRAVIEWALVVVAFSLLPLVMLDLAPGEDLWRVLSACLALSAVAHRLWVGPKLHDLPWGSRSYRTFTYLWLFGTAAILLANGAGLFASATVVYLCGLLAYLFFAMLLFARLLQSLI